MNISGKPTTTASVEIHGNFVDGREIEAGSSEMLDVRRQAARAKYGDLVDRIPALPDSP